MTEYTDEQIEEMREELWLNECDMTSTRDFRAILWTGYKGFENLTRKEVIEMYEQSKYIL